MWIQAFADSEKSNIYTLYFAISAVAPFLSLYSGTKLAAKLYWQLTDTTIGNKITDYNRP